MKIYIISIAAVSVVASFVVLLAPEGKSGGISKFLKLLTSLCILAVISDPLISFSKSILSSKPKNIADTFYLSYHKQKLCFHLNLHLT